MTFTSWKNHWDFSHEVRFKNRYVHSAPIAQFLSDVILTSRNRIKIINKGSIYWRSQLGNEYEPVYQDGELITEEPSPFGPERMKPVKLEASEGRANPKGIPYLYLATDKETAMSEVRPWIGSYISVGQFTTERDLRLIDCSVHHGRCPIYFLKEPNEEEKVQAVWARIDNAFSEPITPSDKSSDYVPTQILAELFRNEGFDGIVYRSALATGFNVALFDIDSARLINCHVYEVKKIEFSFSEAANPYYIRDNEGKPSS